jgi:hypothetical protein
MRSIVKIPNGCAAAARGGGTPFGLRPAGDRPAPCRRPCPTSPSGQASS